MRHPAVPVRLLRFAALLCLGLAGMGVFACSRNAPEVVCTCTYGGASRRLAFAEASDPYSVKPVDIDGRFRLKAIYVRTPWSAASINVYAYHQAEEGDVLLSESKYLPPFSDAGGGGRYGFTGRQLVYSPTQRELEYWCALSP